MSGLKIRKDDIIQGDFWGEQNTENSKMMMAASMMVTLMMNVTMLNRAATRPASDRPDLMPAPLGPQQ